MQSTDEHASTPASNGRLSSYLLDVAYGSAALLASPYLLYKMRTSERYRAGLGQRLGAVTARQGPSPCLWLHAASVGEVQSCRALVEECRKEWPNLELTVSTQTLTGRRQAEKACPGCRLIYYPLDFSPVVDRVLDRVRPSCVALVEREIWPNFVAACTRRGIPVLQINGRITAASLGAYRWLYPVLGPALQSIRRYAVQNEEYAERLRGLAIPSEKIHITGNLKYDSIPMSVPDEEQQRLRRETGLKAGDPVLLCGSIHPPEERILVRVFQRVRKRHPGLRLVLVPRHPERVAEVERSVAEAGESSVRKSELARQGQPGEGAAGRIVLVDTVGELRGLFALATVVFIGGTFVPVGGHNLLEPAALGKPVLFGPHIFQQAADAQALEQAGAAAQCFHEELLAKRLLGLFNDLHASHTMGQAAQAVFRANQGATRRTVELLRQYVMGRGKEQ